MRRNILKEAIEDQKIQIHKDHQTKTNQLEFYTSEIQFFQAELDKIL